MELPVYRLDEKQYYEKRDAYVDEALDSDSYQEFKSRNLEMFNNLKYRLEDAYGGLWRYNEIVGFIRLHFIDNQIRGEYFGVGRKRIVRARRKQFVFKTWKLAPEMNLPLDGSDLEILATIQCYIARCRDELKGRYIDDSQFAVIGPYVAWRRLHQQVMRGAPK